MKKLIVATCVIALTIVFANAATAQSLNTILSKLQAVEERLQELESTPQSGLDGKIDNVEVRVATIDANYKTELTKLSSKIEKIESSQPELTVETYINPLATRVEQLYQEIEDIKRTGRSDGENVNLLVADLGGLVNELRSTISASIANPLQGSSVQLEETPGVSISGFGDFFYSLGDAENENTQISIGQVELDLETSLTNKVDLIGALVFDPADEVFGLGDLFLDFHLFGGEGEIFNFNGIESGGFVLGQFDVPFGIELNVYPSIERKIVSGALVVENTHDSWGDFGVKTYAEGKKFNVAAYAVNGFGYDNVEMRMALGGRFGYKLADNLELGGSYAGFLDGENKADMTLSGVDIQGEFNALTLKGEYIEHSQGAAGDLSLKNTGYYCQGIYNFGQYFAVGRYGSFTPDGGEEITRISTGLGYAIREGLELRSEYQVNSDDTNRTFVQMVVGL